MTDLTGIQLAGFALGFMILSAVAVLGSIVSPGLALAWIALATVSVGAGAHCLYNAYRQERSTRGETA